MSELIVTLGILRITFVILSLSAWILVIKSIRYEDNALILDNKVQYMFLNILLWYTFIYCQYKIIMPPVNYHHVLYFINLATSIIFTISFIMIIQGSVVDDLVIYLPNRYCIFTLIISWFGTLCLDGYEIWKYFPSFFVELKRLLKVPEQVKVDREAKREVRQSVKKHKLEILARKGSKTYKNKEKRKLKRLKKQLKKLSD
jgi:hypothetical protein